MEFTTGISEFNTTYNLNAIDDYNKYLKGQASFEIDKNAFEEALENAAKSYPVKDKADPTGLGNFASSMGNAFSNSLNAVNNAHITADKMQEDIAMGGSTSIHDAMIAAEKASLNMQMAVQVRNRLVSAYTDITQMAI
ncbi:TPA: flagellar hook-basal body complex protein FliE [Candidatus Gastranaerophilales bacterium HUM_3]|jgi:flagellar hook-basal body complex protein fliE|nr:flagellar hook-basal body complex protein FliE [bacterium]OLA73371.1 MAG: flagellar hook-basal body complex protein FliE [Acinetobacter sp. CAG:196_36_41]CCZ50993.1 flagellar hook-basal body complex protein FliE [Acinetobacter sp. CAG:196]DAA81976.1 MAG TPA: flagellar hook-basal body complex protein FliE [Candidatus Gastranaerophilales bacterium HUM_3]DAA85364.1 MAG TPA: flagellar hook-basal body complex protein FliE [Candidatus Gastranaerophilales bacterium HUM_4]DAA88982.1 MAG TPA: flagel